VLGVGDGGDQELPDDLAGALRGVREGRHGLVDALAAHQVGDDPHLPRRHPDVSEAFFGFHLYNQALVVGDLQNQG
jgi:hypothetical protein